jgi:two-component system sensor kinase FixL
MTSTDEKYQRYLELEAYVGWSAADSVRVRQIAPLLRPAFDELIDDFYAEIDRHPRARAVITGGADQVARLKRSLRGWLEELVSGCYDKDYVERRWRVGHRHVEIALSQVYTNAAISRLRRGLLGALGRNWTGDAGAHLAARISLNTRIDLDLAIIEDAYQEEYVARHQRAEQLAAIGHIAAAAECMIVMLRPDGAICYFSPFAQELTGYAAQDVLGRNYPRLFARPEDRESSEARIHQVFQGTVLRGTESIVRTRDGRERWLLWNARRLRDFEGAPALLAVGQDITERRQAQDRALQAERLAAIGQMMAGLTHESRNALQRSKAFLELLADEVADRPEALELIAGANRAQDYLHRLYEEVRGYAAPIIIESRPCNLLEILRETWASLSVNRQHRGIVLHEEIADADPCIHGDPFALGQVIRNILENAIAACAESGAIQVRLSDADLDGQPAARLSIHDSGPGLNEEQRRRIFEPFYTTKTRGTGLGMAIARRIVESHGGRISVGHSSASGAEVILELPRGPRRQ